LAHWLASSLKLAARCPVSGCWPSCTKCRHLTYMSAFVEFAGCRNEQISGHNKRWDWTIEEPAEMAGEPWWSLPSYRTSSFLACTTRRLRSAVHIRQPPQRAVLSRVDCFIQCDVVTFQISLDGVQPRDTGTPWWSLPVLWRGAIRIILASASSSIRPMCPSMERCHDWIIAVRLGCLVIFLTPWLRTNWCHLIPSSVLKHHWWKPSILYASTLVIAQHSDVHRKIDSIQVQWWLKLSECFLVDVFQWMSCCHLCNTGLCIAGGANGWVEQDGREEHWTGSQDRLHVKQSPGDCHSMF